MTARELAAFDRLAAKGGCARSTAQQAADDARRVVEHLLTPEERAAMATARGHVTCPGGRSSADPAGHRREWDGVCARIRARLLS